MGGCCSSNGAAGTTDVTATEPSVSPLHSTSRENFTVFIATWNVGDAVPGPVGPLFAHIADGGAPADIVVVAAQECEYVVPKAGGDGEAADEAAATSKQRVGDHWMSTIDKALPDYVVVAHKGMWSIRVTVLCRRALLPRVGDVAVSREATGLGGVGGNKGGVAISLTAFGTKMLFVGSHLAAHLEHVEMRNSDYHEIIQGIDAGMSRDRVEPLNYFHHVFWCGDLNYRIDLPVEEVVSAASALPQPDLGALLPHDQLINEMAKGNVFQQFAEAGRPMFRPTYRFLRNTTGEHREYDPFKGRIPSWCDRVLHKALGPVDAAKCLKYDAEQGVRSSDHSPVYAIYSLVAREHLVDELAAARGNNDGKATAHVHVRVSSVSAKDLLNADIGGTSDPYAIFSVIDFGGLQLSAAAIDVTTSNPDSAAASASTSSASAGPPETKGAVFSVKSRSIQNTLCPDWGADTFDLDLGARNDTRLHYLHCIMMDEDVTVDDPLGQAVFPLAEVLSHGAGKRVTLTKPVMHAGKPCGTVTCTLEVVERAP